MIEAPPVQKQTHLNNFLALYLCPCSAVCFIVTFWIISRLLQVLFQRQKDSIHLLKLYACVYKYDDLLIDICRPVHQAYFGFLTRNVHIDLSQRGGFHLHCHSHNRKKLLFTCHVLCHNIHAQLVKS